MGKKRISTHVMYDMHLFDELTGSTVDEVIGQWLELNRTPTPAVVGGREVEDLGPAYLCPIRIHRGNERIRDVGAMVFPERADACKKLAEWRHSALTDPDVSRLLSKRVKKATQDDG